MISSNHSNHKVRENMGAVRVQVKLTNAVDEELVNRGLLNPNLLRVCETLALVDYWSNKDCTAKLYSAAT